MKTIIISLTLILIATSLFGQTTVAGEKFTRITIENDAKVFIRQDSICSVRFSGNDNPSDAITSVRNGTLIIEGNPNNELNVSLPVLEQIKIDGHGMVTGISTFNSDNLTLDIGGDGKIMLDVMAKKIDAKISGVGKITLSGTAEAADFDISGSGKVDALGLKTSKSNVNISGVGKCVIDVTDELNTNISGTGNVGYKTIPKKMNENISGMGSVKCTEDASLGYLSKPDTTRLSFGKDQIWIIAKKDSLHTKKNKIKPIWGGFEMGLNSYVGHNGSFTLSPGLENYDLRVEKSISVGLNVVQHHIELGKSNVFLLTGLGITWNNYRFASNVTLDNGAYTYAYKDTTSNNNYIKSKLVAIYLTAPIMIEAFTSHNKKKAFHFGVGGMFGLRIGSHSKQKIESPENDVYKAKVFDDFNLSTFRYGFRVAAGYGKFNIFADYYASTLFKENKGPVLYPVNAGITFIGF